MPSKEYGLLQQVYDQLATTGLVPDGRILTGHHFRVTEIERHVDLEVLELKGDGPRRLEVGISFNGQSKAVNQKNAVAFERFIKTQKAPFTVKVREERICRYLTATFAETDADPVKSSADAALWFSRLPYGRV
jgi:hypothetical protein